MPEQFFSHALPADFEEMQKQGYPYQQFGQERKKMNNDEATTVRDWLRNCGMKCPRCGGAASGYSYWVIEAGDVICDNCFFPRPEDIEPLQPDERWVTTGEGREIIVRVDDED